MTVHGSVSEIAPDRWDSIAAAEDLDYSWRYALYRETQEPGRPAVIAAYDRRGMLRAAAFGATTTPATLAFSNPAQLLLSPQMLRMTIDGGPSPSGGALPFESGLSAPDWVGFATECEQALRRSFVVRSIQDSRVVVDPALPPRERAAAVAAVVQGTKAAATDLSCSSVVFLYVPDSDDDLQVALGLAGFTGGRLCASTRITVRGFSSFADYLASFRKNRRNAIKRERERFASSGLVLREIDLDAQVGDVARLECSTRRRHGGDASATSLAEAKRELKRQLGSSVRAVGCFSGERLVASGVDLVGEHHYYAIAYGAADDVPRHACVYPTVAFYDPIDHAIARGLDSVEFLFEAYWGKLLRGARLQPLDAHVWCETPAATRALERLMRILDARNRVYLAEIAQAASPIRRTELHAHPVGVPR